MLDTKSITIGGHRTIHYDHNRDMIWRYDQVLPAHPNGMRFSVFDEAGDMLATNEYFRWVITRVGNLKDYRTINLTWTVLEVVLS